MSRRLWGACASEPGVLGAALGPERLSLRLEKTDEKPVGWGIGFYEHGEPLVRKRPLEDRAEVDLFGVIAETKTDLLIGHVREPTIGDLRAANTHPFRYRNWLFAHSGTIRRFDEIQEKMRVALPAFLLRSIKGDTDSELFFHLVLAFLHDAGELSKPRIAPAAVAKALTNAVVMVDELEAPSSDEEKSRFNVLISNGTSLVALHRSPCGLYWMEYVAPSRGEIKPRTIIIACDQTVSGSGWREIPNDSTCTIDRQLSVNVAPM